MPDGAPRHFRRRLRVLQLGARRHPKIEGRALLRPNPPPPAPPPRLVVGSVRGGYASGPHPKRPARRSGVSGPAGFPGTGIPGRERPPARDRPHAPPSPFSVQPAAPLVLLPGAAGAGIVAAGLGWDREFRGQHTQLTRPAVRMTAYTTLTGPRIWLAIPHPSAEPGTAILGYREAREAREGTRSGA